VDQLVDSGRRVRILDNLATGHRENLAAAFEAGPNRCELVLGDVRDGAALDAALDGVEDVFHLACLGLRHSLRRPEENHDVNATGSLRLLEAARSAGVRRFLHVSSSEVYGSYALGAGSTRGIDEDHPIRPTTAYGAAKLAGEAYARCYQMVHGLPVVVVRPFNAYGPRSHHEGDAGEVIPRFVVRALAGQPLVIYGDGRQSRDFTNVRDVARGLRLAAASDAAVGEAVNLGSGHEITVLALAEAIREMCGCPDLPIVHESARPGDVRRLLADASRAQRLLGWAPEIAFEEGLRDLVELIASGGQSPQELVSQTANTASWSSSVSAVEDRLKRNY
jgi:UDP-glucose 4-epimerase